MRKIIFETVEPTDSISSRIYNAVMIVAIIASLIPLAFHYDNLVFMRINYVTTVLFSIDYVARLFTADIKVGRGSTSFLVYPFTPMAIIDLMSILPEILSINKVFKLFRLARFFRVMGVLRVFKAARYSKNIDLILRVFRRQQELLSAVCGIAAVYILVSALVIFNAEPGSFPTFFDAVYWAVVSLTTMGYGDIYPVTTIGRVITMLSSILGIAVVAMPASIITAGFMEEAEKTQEDGGKKPSL
ncbi:MAG: ion transporter [Lachnospiraceae bacterium]|nr:ion transporter [Lachnospiraceae bacterium]